VFHIVLPAPALLALTACTALWGPDLTNTPVDTTGYEIEPLPVLITASYARGEDVYLGAAGGRVWRAKDNRLTDRWTDLGRPLDIGPRLLFVSRAGVVFASAEETPVYRTDDAGATWRVCIDIPVWRMDEDDAGNIYAGDYLKDPQHDALLYKSTDGGQSWTVVFQDRATSHIHTVRWDDRAKRLYIAFGDGSQRGEAYSDDRGQSFHILARGPSEGPTDIAICRDYLFSCSDVNSGQVVRVARSGCIDELTIDWQSIWFGVARDEQVYLGTMTTYSTPGERSALLASADQGRTWQKIAETDPSSGPYSQGYYAESRELSAGGWLYYTDGNEHGERSYRVRRAP
jgi:photosystem II stability/assembly factor-like uncharacterized protein